MKIALSVLVVEFNAVVSWFPWIADGVGTSRTAVEYDI